MTKYGLYVGIGLIVVGSVLAAMGLTNGNCMLVATGIVVDFGGVILSMNGIKAEEAADGEGR